MKGMYGAEIRGYTAAASCLACSAKAFSISALRVSSVNASSRLWISALRNFSQQLFSKI
jgi:hypothetical protein